MEELYRVANNYYRKLESFKAYGGFKNLYFITVLVSTLFFICSAWFLFKELIVLKSNTIYSKWFFSMMFAELLIIISINRLQKKKEDNIIRMVNDEMGLPQCNTVGEAKVILLKSYFSCNQQDFSDIAEKIDSMLNRASQFSNNSSKIEKVFSFIYNKEANPRILTLFVLMCSIITVLSVSSGGNLYTAFDIFSGSDNATLATLYFITLAIVLVFGFGATQFFIISQRILIFYSLFFLRRTEKNIETVKYLINDLNNYHIFKKTQDKKIIIIDRKI